MVNADRDILRRLAEQQVEIGSDPVQERTAAEWARLNALGPGRPLVWITEVVGDRYVYSAKPNPAILAPDRWNPDSARSALRELLDQTRGYRVEIILKDISTVRYDPRRLWEWAEIARRECEALV